MKAPILFPGIERYISVFISAGQIEQAEKLFKSHVLRAHTSPDEYYGQDRELQGKLFRRIAERLFPKKVDELCALPELELVDVEDP